MKNDLEEYLLFCEVFLPMVMKGYDWSKSCTQQYVSQFIDPLLEAFAVVAYVNGYRQWMREFENTPNKTSGR